MNDLISRQDAIDAFRKATADGDKVDFCVSVINDLPSAERKGYWEYLYDGNYKCSNCGSWWKCEDEPCKEGLNFCPNCGAKMEVENVN